MTSIPPEQDAEIESQLRNVAVPANFLRELKEIPNQPPFEPGAISEVDLDSSISARIDDQLRDVPIPSGAIQRFHLISEQGLAERKLPSADRRDWARRVAWATAASLLFALASGYWFVWQNQISRFSPVAHFELVQPEFPSDFVDHSDLDRESPFYWAGPSPEQVASHKPDASWTSTRFEEPA